MNVKLKDRALRAGYRSLERLAHDVGCHPRTIYNFSSGKSNLTLDILEKICQVLKCKPNDLLEVERKDG